MATLSHPRAGRVARPAWPALLGVWLLACTAAPPPRPTLREQLGDDGLTWDDPRHAAAAEALARLELDDETLRGRAPQALAEAGAPASLVAVAARADPSLRPALARLAPGRCGQARGPRPLLLCSRVRVEFAVAPTRLEPGQSLRIEGQVLGEARLQEVLLQSPAGEIRSLPTQGRGRGFAVELPPPLAPGCHVVEVMVRGARGIEVAALWDLQVGTGAACAQPVDQVEASDGDAASAARQAFALLLRDRSAAGQPGLEWSDGLAREAQARAAALAARDVLEHGPLDKPGATAAGDGATWTWLGENLARARSVAGARQALQHSPSHRRNRLHPLAQQAGIGAAWRGSGAARTLFIVELLGRPGRALDEAGWRQALGQRVNLRRNQAGCRALERDTGLEAMAARQARHMCQLGALADSDAAGAPLSRAVLDGRNDLVRASAALFALTDPDAAEIPPALLDPRHNVLGAAVARCGASEPWFAVVLVAQRDAAADAPPE